MSSAPAATCARVTGLPCPANNAVLAISWRNIINCGPIRSASNSAAPRWNSTPWRTASALMNTVTSALLLRRIAGDLGFAKGFDPLRAGIRLGDHDHQHAAALGIAVGERSGQYVE